MGPDKARDLIRRDDDLTRRALLLATLWMVRIFSRALPKVRKLAASLLRFLAPTLLRNSLGFSDKAY